MRIIPGRRLIGLLAVAGALLLAGLIAGLQVSLGVWLAVGAVAVLVLLAAADAFTSGRAWRQASPRLRRKLPPAFAIGVKRLVHVAVEIEGVVPWEGVFFDHPDASLKTEGLPLTAALQPNTTFETAYTVLPTRRGDVVFSPAEICVRSRWGLCDLLFTMGECELRRVYADFAQVARYAWLAGDRRLPEIGVKAYRQRGEGTDFKQLSEYRIGDSIRHLDWRATLRQGKPIVREFQDERDQRVLLLVDCGRRMRADDRAGNIGTSHFDQVLNAVMLLTYVALKQGDAVGVMTFGTRAGDERAMPPQKGIGALHALMGALYDVEPSTAHSDYVTAAEELMRHHRKRSLIIVITNFRGEDGTELAHALRLLRSRHLVLLASLRERAVRELMEQPLTGAGAAIETASAHAYEQSRRDAFNRLAARDALMVDADPERLGIELVNRYHAAKRAGLI